ncbi:MAG: hypothetical protein JWR61_3438 [Ferruginibacter sp.]|nr:hypothetical protein [Ferruginibacter sp.]
MQVGRLILNASLQDLAGKCCELALLISISHFKLH